MKEITVPADTEYMDKIYELTGPELDAAGCPEETRTQIDIACEEIFVNICSYAYDSGKGEAKIAAELSGDPPVITIRFTDRGEPFDPLAQEDPDTGEATDTRPIGGLGIYMVKEMMDEMEYAYEDGCNILTIRKTCV